MGMLYVIDNFISSDTPLYSSSINPAAWVSLDLIYNKRPSKPFRWEGQGTPANPEWICVDLLQVRNVTFCGVFNHNFLLTGSADSLFIQNCNLPCRGQSNACNWDAADEEDLMDRLVNNFRNLYEVIDFTNQYFTLEIVDQNNPVPIEVGDWVLVKGSAGPGDSIEAEWVKQVGKGRGKNDDQDKPEGKKDNSAFCAEDKQEKPHPLVAKVGERFAVPEEGWVMDYFCDGYGMGAIMLALKTSELEGSTPEELLARRAEGDGWGQIWKEKDLIDSEKEGHSPPGLLKRPDHASPENKDE